MVIQRDSSHYSGSSSPVASPFRTCSHMSAYRSPSRSSSRSPSRSPSPTADERLESFSAKSKFRRSFKKGIGLLFLSNNAKSKLKRPVSVPGTPVSTPQLQHWRSRTPSLDGPMEAMPSHPLRATSRGPSPVPSPVGGKRRSAASLALKSMFPKWKSRSKGGGVPSLWSPSPESRNRWTSVRGRSIALQDVALSDLSEPERAALVRIALERLSAMNLGTVTAPKDGSRKGLFKRGIALRKSKGNDKDRSNRDSSPAGLVFGQRLSKVLTNDKAAQSIGRPSVLSSERLPSLSSSSYSTSCLPRLRDLSTSSSTSSISDAVSTLQPPPPPSDDNENDAFKPQCYDLNFSANDDWAPTSPQRRTVASVVIQSGVIAGDVAVGKRANFRQNRKNSAPDVPFPVKERLMNVIEAQGKKADKEHSFMPLPVQVPVIVTKSIRFLEEHGLHSTGLFRVSSSKKRVRQMKEDWDAGRDVHFSPDSNPHDVAALLKMFLRDLPEPLLTRELYAPFIATRKLDDEETRLSALNLLCALLPPPNRDMLSELLRFLNQLAKHADCNCDVAADDQERGNKMSIANLATVIGPNILHKLKSSQKEREFAIVKQDQADNREEVIAVVRDLICHYQDIGKISANIYDTVLRRLLIDEPEAVDFVLTKKRIDSSDSARDSNDEDDNLYFSEDHYAKDSRGFHDSLTDDSDSFVLCNPALRLSHKVDSFHSLNLTTFDSMEPSAEIRTSGSTSDLKFEQFPPRGKLRSAPQTPIRQNLTKLSSVRTTFTPPTPPQAAQRRRRLSPDTQRTVELHKTNGIENLHDSDSAEDVLTLMWAGSESGGTPASPLSLRSSAGEVEVADNVDDKINGVSAFPWQNKEQLKEWGLQVGDIELLEHETLV